MVVAYLIGTVAEILLLGPSVLAVFGATSANRWAWIGIGSAVGLIMLLTGITYGIQPYGGHSMGWTSPLVLTGLIGGPVLLALFCFIETKVEAPMFDLHLMKIRAFAAGISATLLASIRKANSRVRQARSRHP